jgi:hypothetical protein
LRRHDGIPRNAGRGKSPVLSGLSVKENVTAALDYLSVRNSRDGAWAFSRAALSSGASLAVIPVQDYLGLGEAPG